MEMQLIISQLATLFIMLAIGFVAGKTKVLTTDAGSVLSKVVINITAPCTVLASVMSNDVRITTGETAFFVLLSFLAFLLFLLIAIPSARLLGGDKGNRGLYGYMAVFGNAIFMGFPVVLAIFGAASAFYVALFNIPFKLLTFSVGIIMISGKGRRFDPKTLLNPAIVAVFLAIVIALTDFETPAVVAHTVAVVGSMTTPAAMIAIGVTLAYTPLKGIFSEWRLYPVTILKLIVMPVVVWLVFRHFVTDELMLGVLVVLSGMPVAAMAAMLAIEYGGNERLASSGIFISTLLSGVTIPLIVYLLL